MTNYEYYKSLSLDDMSRAIAISRECWFCPFQADSSKCILNNCVDVAKKFLESEYKE